MADQDNNSKNQSGLLKNDYVENGVAEGLSRKREKMAENLKDRFGSPIDNVGRMKEEDV